MSGSKKGIALHSIANYGRFLLTMVVQFALTPYIIGRIGEKDFGLWTLTFSVVGFLGLLDGGLATSSVKFVAECRGSGDVERRNRIVSSLAAAYLGLALLSIVVVFGLSFGYNRLFGIPHEQEAKAVAVLWLIATRAVILALPLGLFYGILFGEKRLPEIYLIQSVATVLYGIAVYIGLGMQGDIILLGWLNLGAMLVEYIAYVILAYRVVPDLRIAPDRVDGKTLKEVAGFSGAQLLVNVAALVRLRTDPILVKLLLSMTSVAIYGVALRIAESVYLLLKQGINVLAPTIAERHGANDLEQVRSVLLQASRGVFAFAAILCVPLCLLATDILTIWVGPNFASGGPVLIILLVAMLLAIPPQVAGLALAMTGQHGLSARAQVVGMLVNLGGSVILAPLVGLPGVALGTLLATLIVDVGWVMPVALKQYQIRAGTYLRQVVVPAVAGGLLQAIVTLGMRAAFTPTSLFSIALLAIPGGVVFLAVFLMALPGEERIALTQGTIRRLRRA